MFVRKRGQETANGATLPALKGSGSTSKKPEDAVSADDDLQPSEIAEASAQLNEGLKTCRTVVDDYRSLLSGTVRVVQPANDQEENIPPQPNAE